MTIIKNPHDEAFNAILSDQRMAKAFFVQHLPADLQKILKLDTLKVAKSIIVDENLKRTINDIVYEVDTIAGKGYLILHLEHLSTPQKDMPLRFLEYAVRGMRQHLKAGHKTLPVIIPVLYYHGKVSPYPWSLDIFDGFDNKALAREYLFKPACLIDLTTIPDEELKQHTETALFQMVQKHIFERDLLPVLEDLAQSKILEKVAQEVGRNHFQIVISYIVARAEISDGERLKTLLTEHSGEAGEEFMTLLQQYEREKREQFRYGMQEGMQQGRQQGMRQGEHTVLLRQLKKKFPYIPAAYLHRLENAPEDSLLAWSERLLDAATVEEIFRDDE